MTGAMRWMGVAAGVAESRRGAMCLMRDDDHVGLRSSRHVAMRNQNGTSRERWDGGVDRQDLPEMDDLPCQGWKSWSGSRPGR